MTKKRNLIQVWLPGMTLTGGIQAFSKDLLAALRESDADIQKIVMIKGDLPGTAKDSNAVTCYCFGRWPQRLRTAAFTLGLILSAIIYRPGLIVVGHANFAKVASFLNRLLGIRYWVIVYGIEVWDENGKRVAASLRSADRLLSISAFTRDKIIEQTGIDAARFMMLPTTFDATRFQPKPKPVALQNRLGLRADQPVILTVARLSAEERYKGYDQIISAMPAVLQAIPDAHYVLVGRGADEGRIRNLIAELRLEPNVTLAGFVSEEELADYYNLCDVFAMPSKKEGFGIVFLEALACGKAVLAGNKDGSVDAVCRGELGALIDPDNLDEIARSLIDILCGSYPLPVLYQPDELRRKVIAQYGFNRFAATLTRYLREFFEASEARRRNSFKESQRLHSINLQPEKSQPDNQ